VRLPTGERSGMVVSVNRSAAHRFSKQPVPAVRLVEGLGVERDAHAGVTVQHRSRVAQDPTSANLRQVHLLPAELLAELANRGHRVWPGDLGENITTEGLDLLGLPVGTRLRLGRSAAVTVTGLRNPCSQIEDFQAGLLKQVLRRAADGSVVRLAGIMGVVSVGGVVRVDDPIEVSLPAPPHQALERV
jgi:MOSC domain-containing protein YiiM